MNDQTASKNAATEEWMTEEERLAIQSKFLKQLTAVIVGLVILWFTWLFLRPSDSHYEAGMTEYDAGRYARAAAEFQSDVKWFPDHSLGCYYLGKSLEGEGRLTDAAAAYRKASAAEMASDSPDKAFAAKCMAHAASCRGSLRSRPSGIASVSGPVRMRPRS